MGNETSLSQHYCPHLGAVDADQVRTDAIAHPSFEQRCWAPGLREFDEYEMLMLTDQATYCLGKSHVFCPRYAAAMATQPGRRGATAPVTPLTPEEAARNAEWVATDIQDLERELTFMDEEEAERRRVWGWLAAAAIFLLVVGGGSIAALYAGWNAMRNAQMATDAVEILAAAQLPQEPVYLVMTATVPPQPTQTATMLGVLIAPPPTIDNSAPGFPPAVTATPGGDPGAGEPPVIIVDPNVPPATPMPLPPTPTPIFDLGQPVADPPTRRPTPTFEIPTSTPADAVQPTVIIQYVAPPIISFKPDQRSLERKQCTTVRWAVQNVSEVYYEGIGVNGEGSQEECIDEEDEVYSLAVVLTTGVTEIYTTTIKYIAPTPTPTASPSVTPTPYHTPTWTPEAPTATPTPNLTFGVNLGVEGSVTRGCAAGGACSATVVVSNQGNGNDDLILVLQAGADWAPQLCRGDGVCADHTLVINNVGPGNQARVEFRVNIPADAQGQSAQYTLVAGSGATNNAVRSQPVTITMQAE